MRYFYIFILTLVLISCNEKKGYGTTIEYGERIKDISESECRDANAKGNILTHYEINDLTHKVVLYKRYVYLIYQYTYAHICVHKRKYHDK